MRWELEIAIRTQSWGNQYWQLGGNQCSIGNLVGIGNQESVMGESALAIRWESALAIRWESEIAMRWELENAIR